MGGERCRRDQCCQQQQRRRCRDAQCAPEQPRLVAGAHGHHGGLLERGFRAGQCCLADVSSLNSLQELSYASTPCSYYITLSLWSILTLPVCGCWRSGLVTADYASRITRKEFRLSGMLDFQCNSVG